MARYGALRVLRCGLRASRRVRWTALANRSTRALPLAPLLPATGSYAFSVGQRAEGHIIVKSATMNCRSDGSAGGSRTAAWCSSPKIGDLSCAVVQSDGAVRWPRYWRNHECP
jgi:hypothetical protein